MKVGKTEIENLFKSCRFPDSYFLVYDQIKGKTRALASYESSERETYNVLSNFMDNKELKSYLLGYLKGKKV